MGGRIFASFIDGYPGLMVDLSVARTTLASALTNRGDLLRKSQLLSFHANHGNYGSIFPGHSSSLALNVLEC